MPKEKNELLNVNPLVETLAKHVDQGGVAKIGGWVGPSASDKVRIYQSLTVSRYVEISRDAVVHVSKAPDGRDGRVEVYVSRSAKVVVVDMSSVVLTAGELGPDGVIKQISPMGGWGPNRCVGHLNGIRTINAALKSFQEIDDAYGSDISNSDAAQELKSQRDRLQDAADVDCPG